MDALRQWQADWPFVFDVFKFANGLLLLALVFVPLEKAFALRPRAARRAAWGTDIGYYFLSSLLPGRIIVLPVAALVWALQAVAPLGLFPGLAGLPPAARFAAALLVAETGFYWGHRWMHASPWLWRFHAVHHSATQMDWLVNTRAHPLDLVVTRLCGLLPLYLLGLVRLGGGELDGLPLLVALLGSSWGYLIHANLRWRLGPLERAVATPAFHHWHHDHQGEGGSRHANYAAMLPLMDMLFGTYRRPGAAWPERYGTDEPVPPALVDQIMSPFMGRAPPPGRK